MKCIVCDCLTGLNYPYYPIEYQLDPKTKWIISNLSVCDNGCIKSFGFPRFKLWKKEDKNIFNLLLDMSKEN